MNPSCPECGRRLELKTYNYEGIKDDLGIIRFLRGDFYICKKDKIHWPRSAVISKNTKRPGARPRKKA